MYSKKQKTTEEKQNMYPYCLCDAIQISGRGGRTICLEMQTLRELHCYLCYYSPSISLNQSGRSPLISAIHTFSLQELQLTGYFLSFLNDFLGRLVRY